MRRSGRHVRIDGWSWVVNAGRLGLRRRWRAKRLLQLVCWGALRHMIETLPPTRPADGCVNAHAGHVRER